MTEWRTIGASIAGPAHRLARQACQDATDAVTVECSDGQTLCLIAAADGAGTARHAAEGARLAIDSMLSELTTALEKEGLDALTETQMRRAFGVARQRVLAAATDDIPHYSATLLIAALGADFAVLAQIGDGGIAYRDADSGWRCAVWPQRAGFANVTYFLIDPDSDKRASIMRVENVAEVALFTDGLDECALDLRAQLPHAPFFDALFGEWKRRTPLRTRRRSSSRWLESWLKSKPVQARSRDDKTLVLCRRED